MNFAKFLRTSFFIEQLQWLLLVVVELEELLLSVKRNTLFIKMLNSAEQETQSSEELLSEITLV